MIESVALRDKKDLSDLFEEAGIYIDITDDLFLEFSKKLAFNLEGVTDKAMAIAKTLVEFSKVSKARKDSEEL